MAKLTRLVKAALDGVALCLVAPCAFVCWMERTVSPGSEANFVFWTHVFALAPGLAGVFLRRAFYRQTLTKCGPGLDMMFGALFAHREADVEDHVYIGPFAMIGRTRLGTGSLIGTRASVLSRSTQHTMGDDGRWTPFDRSDHGQTSIGRHCWIGEGAIVMADIADGSLVSAGAVVAAAVPAGIVVAGNPARFVRKVRPDSLATSLVDSQSAAR